MSERKRQGQATKRRVAEAARELFALKGYTATSIEEIAEASGSSKGNIYYHFSSKEGLFIYLLNEWDQEWLAKWEERKGQCVSVRDKLTVLSHLYVEHDLNHPLTKAYDEFVAVEADNNEVKLETDRYMENRMSFNRELLEEGMRTGELKKEDAALLSLVLESWFMGVGEMARRFAKDSSALELYLKSVDVFLNGVQAEK